MAVRRQHIRRLASQLVQQHGVDVPPVPVRKIAAAAGVRVVSAAAETGVSGFLLRRPQAEGLVIGVNSGDGASRQRFTIAHELGHFFLHAGEELHVDRTATIYHRSPRSSEGVDEGEIEANLFAAELLMPQEFIEKDLASRGYVDLADEKQVWRLAKRYGVSTQAMSIRLTYLGWLSA